MQGNSDVQKHLKLCIEKTQNCYLKHPNPPTHPQSHNHFIPKKIVNVFTLVNSYYIIQLSF